MYFSIEKVDDLGQVTGGVLNSGNSEIRAIEPPLEFKVRPSAESMTGPDLEVRDGEALKFVAFHDRKKFRFGSSGTFEIMARVVGSGVKERMRVSGTDSKEVPVQRYPLSGQEL